MPTQVEKRGDGNRLVHEFPGVVPELDMTADPWNLEDGQASIVEGVDVTVANALRIAPMRDPEGMITLSPYSASNPIVEAFGSEMFGPCPKRYATTLKRNFTAAVNTYDDTGNGAGEHALVHTGAFTNYDWDSGDHAVIYDGLDVYESAVASRVSDDAILLADSLGGDLTTVNVEIVKGRSLFYFRSGASLTPHYLIKSPEEYALTGAWPEQMEGAYIVSNADGRHAATQIGLITGRVGIISSNDALRYIGFGTQLVAEDKISILFSQQFDKRGVWASDGEKLALLQNFLWGLYLDLNNNSTIGESWRMAMISPHLLLLVNDKYAPRIIRLDASAQTANTNPRDLTIAGLLTPKKPETSESDGDDDGRTQYKSWVMVANGSGGSLSAGTYRVKVRAVNYIDNAESRFVDVYDSADLDDKDITATSSDALKVWNQLSTDTHLNWPPMHERWTHLEIWRTQANGSAYFLERIIEINTFCANEDGQASTSGTLVQQTTDSGIFACSISDASLANQPQATSADLAAGGPPPICKDAVSLSGVTLCFGAASEDAEDPTFDARMFPMHGQSKSGYTHASRQVNFGSGSPLANYAFVAGDRLEVFSPTAAIGVYPINSRISDSIVDLTAPGIGANYDELDMCILRAHTIVWPKIASDEDVWYSRTDKFAPESFPTRKLTLSSLGDTYRRAVRTGRYVAVIMDQGVHVLYLSGSDLLKTTIASSGMGTPWSKSVVSLGNFVFWATKIGPRMMRTSADVDDQGNLGSISFMPGSERVRQWFEDAFNDGDDVDAGVDTLHQCIRFRKSPDTNNYQSLQFSFVTGKWGVYPDDSGVAYVSTKYAGAMPLLSPALYSVTQRGNLFRLNSVKLTHAYDSRPCQGVLNGTYTITTTSLTKTNEFSAAMVGDIVRFRSSDPSIDGQSRRILTASTSQITFDAVTGLGNGVEYIVGAPRMRIRYAPLRGQGDPMNTKTIEGNLCVAIPGPRHTDPSGGWPDTPPGSVKMKSYRDYVPTTEHEDGFNISVFRDDTVAKKSEDRYGALQCQGRAIEVELECLDAKTDLRIERTMVRFREDGDTVEDDRTDA